jgi:HK97 gp10 family phage protein
MVRDFMSITLDLDNPKAVKTALGTLPEKMLEYAEEVLIKQAELIKGLAQIYVPVDTGSLRDSIRVERGGAGLHRRQIRVRAGGYVTNPRSGQKVAYAKFIEYGTQNMPGYFYLSTAVAEVKPTIAEMIKANVVQKVQP